MRKITMRLKIKRLIEILVIGIILIGGYVILNIFQEIEIDFPIDSEKEAITYAKTDPDVKKFIESCSAEGWKVDSWAYFIDSENSWELGFEAQSHFWQSSVKDVFFVIRFKPNGTIMSKGPGAI